MKLYLQNIVENIYLEILPANWLGIEMGEHLYSVLLPRMKKDFACDKSGISKELKTPHFFGDPSTRGEFSPTHFQLIHFPIFSEKIIADL